MPGETGVLRAFYFPVAILAEARQSVDLILCYTIHQ